MRGCLHSLVDTPDSRYYRNNGEGLFDDVSSVDFPARTDLDSYLYILAGPGDFDNDGDIDIAYHGLTTRGYFQNNYKETGTANLTRGWFLYRGAGNQWNTLPTGFGVFDFDLDGYLDFGFSNYSDPSHHRLLKNNLETPVSFIEYKMATDGHGSTEARGLGVTDWNMDGFSELFIANILGASHAFFRNTNAINNSNINHWVGIRLDASQETPDGEPQVDFPCNTRGIGATVIISTTEGHTQAQVVDGGSGNANQHDLDLSFGLGSYDGLVDVKVIWPCGQIQKVKVSSDQYHTLSLGWPEVSTGNTTAYMEWQPGSPTMSWVFEWETDSPSDDSLDYVEFPDGVADGGTIVYFIDASTPNVEYTINTTSLGKYKHTMKWLSRPCNLNMKVSYTIHSRILEKDFTVSKKLMLINCPVSE